MTDAPRLHDVIAALQRGDVDAALEAGLMEVAQADDLDHANIPAIERNRILIAATKLRGAWDARERYRARQGRLEERARKREVRRANAPTNASMPAPALPAAAADALAKALARAKGG